MIIHLSRSLNQTLVQVNIQYYIIPNNSEILVLIIKISLRLIMIMTKQTNVQYDISHYYMYELDYIQYFLFL